MKVSYKGNEIEVWKIGHDVNQPDWVKKEFTQVGGFKWQDKTHLRVGYGMVYGAVVASVGEFVVKDSHEIISPKKIADFKVLENEDLANVNGGSNFHPIYIPIGGPATIGLKIGQMIWSSFK